MSIKKYLKPTPDYEIPNTSSYSTDGQNLRCYKLGNAGDIVGYEWCFATNYNDENRYENTILGTSDSLETNKNGYVTEDVDGNLYFTLNKDNLADNYSVLSGGLCGGILYVPNDVAEADIHNCCVIENLDFNRVLLKVTAYGTVNNPVVAEKINIDSETESVLNAGYLIEVNILSNNVLNTVETIGIRYVEYFASDSVEYIKPYYINARELQPNSRNNTQSAELVYNDSPLSKPYYGEQDGLTFNTPYWDGKHHIVTTMYPAEKYKLWEEQTRTTQYYNYYAAYVTNQATVKDLIHLLNSSGLRYYDSDHNEITDIKNNVFIGVMDEDGVTDCYNRIKGWDEIEESDLPNKDRNGYDWDVVDPTKPPTPEPTDEDDTEKMEIGGWYTAGGMVNYYAISEKSTLDNLSTCLSSWDYVATGKDVLRNLISLKAFPIERENLCRGTLQQIVIAGVKAAIPGTPGTIPSDNPLFPGGVPDDTPVEDTPIRAYTVDSTYASLNFGSIEIPAKFGDFRDFAPYTNIEIFIPFCGWVGLPSHCMNHSIKVELTYDIITGACKAFVMLDDNTIVAEVSGVMSFDIPFTADAAGMKAASVTSGVLGVASGALGTIGSLGLGAGFSAMNFASSSVGLANSISQLVIANNTNYTEVRGNTGDSNNFAGPKNCFLKISRPISNIPDNYPRVVGWLYNKSATLESGMGFTTIDNPIIHGSMTKPEKSSIQSLLTNGVIL